VKAQQEFAPTRLKAQLKKLKAPIFFRRTGISMTRGFSSSLQISLIHITTTVAECYF
jgi:hypothetical protein